MKTKIFLILSAFLFSSCISSTKTVNGNGNVIENKPIVSYFNTIDISVNSCSTITFRQENDYSLTFCIDENLMQYINVKNSENKLVISSTRGIELNPTKFNIIICAPNIEEFEISGCSSLTFDTPIYLTKLELEVYGSSRINFPNKVNINNMDIEIYGSGSVQIGSGSVKTIDIDINGSGEIESNCDADFVEAEIAGTGNLTINASKLLKYNIAGSGTINYRGDAQTSGNIIGSGEIIKR